jgi:hypothetical protein
VVVGTHRRHASVDRTDVPTGTRPMLGVPTPPSRAQRRRAVVPRAAASSRRERAERRRAMDGGDADRARERPFSPCAAWRRR